MPVTIASQVEAGRKQADRDKARLALQTADRVARQVFPVYAGTLASNPADLYRRWLVQDLLLSQAQRTLDDHWYSEEATAPQPYYRSAGLVYLDDVKRLVPRQTPQTQSLADSLQERLKLPGELALSNLGAVPITSEQTFPVEYQVTPVPGAWVPAGQPVFWVEPDKFLETLEPPATSRIVRTVGGDKPTEPVRATLRSPYLAQAEGSPPPLPLRERTNVRIRGLFRGQRIDRLTPIDLYPLADNTVLQTPRPATGTMTVRAPKELQVRFGAGNGAVTFVVDCSGSMGEPPGKPYTPLTKYNEVTTAIERVLKKLPKGTTISLWVFGQAIGAGKVADRPEDTITRIQEPVAWDPTDTNQLRRLMDRIRYPALEPWNESPIVRTMLRAKEDLKNATGFKTMVVLTDGMDNRFAGDREYNPQGRSIQAVLREQFQDSGIVLTVVGFKIVNKEEQAAREQFSVIESFPLPGKFYDVAKVEDLAIALEKSVRQRLRYFLDHEDNSLVAGLPTEGLDVSQIGSNNQWFPYTLAPGGYKIRTYTTERVQKSVIIDPGDLLMVELLGIGKGFNLRRTLYSRDDFPTKPSQTKADWRLAVLQNQRVGDRGLQLFTTLEKAPLQEEAILQVVKPRETWLELKPTDVDAPYAQRWAYRYGYPAPAWTLDVPSWPQRAGVEVPALPALRVWWNPDVEFAPAALVERDPTAKELVGLTNRKLFVDGGTVVLESIRVEKHVVETKPGTRAVQSCLVVRLSHPPGKPVFARVRGVKTEGFEHRFYQEPSKVACLFWPAEEADARAALSAVGVVSLTAYKRDAEQRGYYAEMDQLGVPQATDVRPLPPVELK